MASTLEDKLAQLSPERRQRVEEMGKVLIEREHEWWRSPAPTLTAQEHTSLDLLYRRLQYHRADGELLEGAVTLLVVAPSSSSPDFTIHLTNLSRKLALKFP